ncbi:MAG: NGG1p interacting factor NIF3 [Spirochaetota bacterium]|mgnify:CR=1 FL=1
MANLTIKELHEAGVKAGIAHDPRGSIFMGEELARRRKEFEKITDAKKKASFDEETLWNPYVDCRILNGDVSKQVKKVIVGIDMEAPEVLLTDRLNEKGAGIDCVIAHHPEGRAYANFYEVMDMQAEVLARHGVPIAQAEGALSKRIREVGRSVSPNNHTRAVDHARLLGIPMVCMHTVADNQVDQFLSALIAEKKPYTVGDILEILGELPEYQASVKDNNAPNLFNGSEKNRAGKVYFHMTGGTSGSEEEMDQLARAGIGTLVVMHIPDKHRERCEKSYINIVCAGHMGSDSLGLNLLFSRIMQATKSQFDIVATSGYYYVKR